MERITFQNSRHLTLAGNFHLASPHSVIIMCHGFTSDKSSRGRFDRFAKHFHEMGYSVLAFDFSGCGESDDDRMTLAKLVDDLRSAIVYVKSRGYSRISLYGHSLGSRVCLESYSPEITTMVLSGAGTGPVTYKWDEHFTAEQMQELSEKGYITEHRLTGLRNTMIIDKQMLRDFEDFNQETLLSQVKCPVLILHGNNDWEEKLLSAITLQGMKWLPPASRLEIIDGAEHHFLGHLPIVETHASDWYRRYFPLNL